MLRGFLGKPFGYLGFGVMKRDQIQALGIAAQVRVQQFETLRVQPVDHASMEIHLAAQLETLADGAQGQGFCRRLRCFRQGL
ncbi:hypothetical protein D3C84_976190 [compost metagenome]